MSRALFCTGVAGALFGVRFSLFFKHFYSLCAVSATSVDAAYTAHVQIRRPGTASHVPVQQHHQQLSKKRTSIPGKVRRTKSAGAEGMPASASARTHAKWAAQSLPRHVSVERGAMASGQSAPEAATRSGANTWVTPQARTFHFMSSALPGPTPEHVALAEKLLSAAIGAHVAQLVKIDGQTKIAHVEQLFGTTFSALAAMPASDINALVSKVNADRVQVFYAVCHVNSECPIRLSTLAVSIFFGACG